MKKLIALFLLTSVAVYYFTQMDRTSKPQKKESSTKNEKLAHTKLKNQLSAKAPSKDISIIKTHIKKLPPTDIWNEMTDFSMSDQEIINKVDPIKLYEYTKGTISDLSSCISDHCGLKPDKDGFFDETNTAADVMLKRNLRLLTHTLGNNNILNVDLSDIQYEKLFSSKNPEVQKEAIKLFLMTEKTDESIKKLFGYIEQFQDETKGSFVSTMDELTSNNENLRELYNESIDEILVNDGGNAAVNVLENMSRNISQDNLERRIKKTCSLKGDNGLWKAYRGNYLDIIEKNNYNTDIDSICP